MRYVRRNASGAIDGSYAQQETYATEAMDENAPEYVAWMASLVAPATIPLSTLQARIEAENMWDTYVNYMFGAPARRNAFLKTMFVGKALAISSNGFKSSLLNAGCTQAQVDRITAL